MHLKNKNLNAHTHTEEKTASIHCYKWMWVENKTGNFIWIYQTCANIRFGCFFVHSISLSYSNCLLLLFVFDCICICIYWISPVAELKEKKKNYTYEHLESINRKASILPYSSFNAIVMNANDILKTVSNTGNMHIHRIVISIDGTSTHKMSSRKNQLKINTVSWSVLTSIWWYAIF